MQMANVDEHPEGDRMLIPGLGVLLGFVLLQGQAWRGGGSDAGSQLAAACS